MGRHAAPDGAPADPLVAAALTRRAAGAARHDGGEEGGLGGLGWPRPPAPGGGRTGWPERDADDVPATMPAPESGPPAQPAPAQNRRGWRRLLGPRAA